MRMLSRSVFDGILWVHPRAPRPRMRLITPPSGSVVTLTQAKSHARVETVADDDLLTLLISSATDVCEQWLRGRKLLTQTWEASYEDTPLGWSFELPPLRPVQSVVAIGTYAQGGTFQAADPSTYAVDTSDSERIRIELEPLGASWPVGQRTFSPFSVQYTVGYGAAGDVPGSILMAILMTVTQWYDDRSSMSGGVPSDAQALLQPYRLYALGNR